MLELNSGSQINTCDPCPDHRLAKGTWLDQDFIDGSPSGTRAQGGEQSTRSILEPLAQSYLSVREGRDQELTKLAEDELREAMVHAGVLFHATVWKKRPQTIRLRPKCCGVQPGKNDDAEKWLKKNKLPSGKPEAVQERLDQGTPVPGELFQVLWEIETE